MPRVGLILFTKKRYVGNKYEFDHNKYKQTSMGIVLKRRDNAPIVKHVFGNVIEKIMIEKDFELAVNWLKETLQMIRNKDFSSRYFVITKSSSAEVKLYLDLISLLIISKTGKTPLLGIIKCLISM